MSSLKQTIVAAVMRVTSDSKYQDRQYKTPQEARDDFIKGLLAELFPESEENSVEIPVLEEAMATLTLEESKKPEPKKKPGPKAKVKPEGPVNIEKLNPTQTKKLKAASEELKVELDKKGYLAYLNNLTPEDFDAKKFEDHIKDFLAPPPPVEEPKTEVAEVELVEVEFDDETCLVDPTTKKG